MSDKDTTPSEPPQKEPPPQREERPPPQPERKLDPDRFYGDEDGKSDLNLGSDD